MSTYRIRTSYGDFDTERKEYIARQVILEIDIDWARLGRFLAARARSTKHKKTKQLRGMIIAAIVETEAETGS